jgi:hypothetical protein
MTHPADKSAVLTALRRADQVIGIADGHGWPRPQGYVDALALLNAARAAERKPPAAPPTPQKAKDVEKWIDTVAEIRHRENTRRPVIDELISTLEREAAAAGLAAGPDIVARLVARFNELIAELDAHADAPTLLTGHETDEQIAAHTAALRLAGDLSTVLMQRAVLADIAGEGGDVGSDVLWLVLDPAPAATRNQIESALDTFRVRAPQALSEWSGLRPLGLRLAQLGEVSARRDRHAALLWRAGMETHDLGMEDHSYGEIESGQHISRNGHSIQSESDAMFDAATPISL